MSVRSLFSLAAMVVIALVLGGRSYAEKINQVVVSRGGVPAPAGVDTLLYANEIYKCAGIDLPSSASPQATQEIGKLSAGDYICSGLIEANLKKIEIMRIDGCKPFPAD